MCEADERNRDVGLMKPTCIMTWFVKALLLVHLKKKQTNIPSWRPSHTQPKSKQTPSDPSLKKPQLGSSCWNLATISTESLAKCRYDQGGSYLKAALSAGLAWKRRLTEPSGTQIGWKQLALQDEQPRKWRASVAGVVPCFCPVVFVIFVGQIH